MLRLRAGRVATMAALVLVLLTASAGHIAKTFGNSKSPQSFWANGLFHLADVSSPDMLCFCIAFVTCQSYSSLTVRAVIKA